MLLFATSNADQLRLVGWVLLAFVLGGLVGLEREYRGHEAGVRTTALVCAGAAMFTQASLQTGDTRIAAGVVQGIGFLGAGLVFHTGGRNVRGVTTAATVWAVAAVGILVGERLWLSGVLAALAIVVALELAPLSDWVLAAGESRRRKRREEQEAANSTFGA